MGGCMSNLDQPSRTRREQPIIQSQDPTLHNQPTNGDLSISCRFTNIKLKRCSSFYQKLALRFQVGKFQCWQTKPKYIINESAKVSDWLLQWEIEHTLTFNTSEQTLKVNNLGIYIMDDHNRDIGNMSINLYLLAGGPYHQDFGISIPQAKGARISFDLKISQRVGLCLDVMEVQYVPRDRDFPGDMFAFAVKTIIGNRILESEMSERFVLKLQSQISGRNQDKRSNKSINSQRQQKQSIKWKQLNKSNSILTLNYQAQLYELSNASFNMIFYNSDGQSMKYTSQSYLSYVKIAEEEYKQIRENSTNIIWLQRQVKYQLRAWNRGKQMGAVKVSLIFKIERHIKQMNLCIRTQNGIVLSSPVFDAGISSQKMPQQLQKLENASEKIQSLFLQLSKNDLKIPRENILKQINLYLQQQLQTLNKTYKQSKMMFRYPNEKALLKGQQMLIEIGYRIKNILNEDFQSAKMSCWQLLMAIIKRGELSLHHMQYTADEMGQIEGGSLSDYLKKKIKTSMSYYLLMLDLLNITLKSLEYYSCGNQKEFAETFCAHAYFRIPIFRNEILTAISKSSDPKEVQQLQEQYDYFQSMSMSESHQFDKNTHEALLDWQHKFHKIIQKNSQKFLQAQKKISHMLRYNGWQQRLKKRSGAFFAFVSCWIKYIEQNVPNSKHISWKYIPGYRKILHSFMIQMKSRNLMKYPQTMKGSFTNLLANSRLITPFVMIILNKTNLHDQNGVVKAIDLMHHLFGSLAMRNQNIHSNFDSKLFTSTVKTLLSVDSAYSLGKIMLLIYNHFSIFPYDCRFQLTDHLITKCFFRLFLHWSQNIRQIYHTLLVTLIYRCTIPISQLDRFSQIFHREYPQYRVEVLKRYEKLMNILENLESGQHRLFKVEFSALEKEQFKRMRNKMNQKRWKKEKPIEKGGQQSAVQSLMLQLSIKRPNSLILDVKKPIARFESDHLLRRYSDTKDEVIIKSPSKRKQHNSPPPRKKSIYSSNFQEQLVAIKSHQFVYIKSALEQFRKTSQKVKSYYLRQKREVIPLNFSLPVDEKDLRPNEIFEQEQW